MTGWAFSLPQGTYKDETVSRNTPDGGTVTITAKGGQLYVMFLPKTGDTK